MKDDRKAVEDRAIKAVEEARAGLLASHPFLGYLSFKMEWIPDWTCQTAWTDGVQVGFNPGFVLSLSMGQRKFLIAHEIGHPMLGHHLRRNDRDPEKWNIACDYVLNIMLVDQRLQRIQDTLLDWSFKGMASEEAFNKLFPPDQAQNPSKMTQDRSKGQGESKDGKDQNRTKDGGKGGKNNDSETEDAGTKDKEQAGGTGNGPRHAGGDPQQKRDDSGRGDGGQSGADSQPESGSGTGAGSQEGTAGADGRGSGSDSQAGPDTSSTGKNFGCGEVRDYPGKGGTPTQEELEIEAERWDIAIQQAAQMTRKMQGHVPGWVETLLTDISDPKLVGEEVIARWVDQRAKDNYTFSRPNFRYIQSGAFLPSLHSEDLGEVAIFWDTSGSVSDSQVAEIAGFTIAILDMYPGVTVRLYHIDKMVRHVETLTSNTDWSRISAKGRGGTDFRPGFEYLEEDHEIDPVGVIYLTDGECSDFPASEPPIPVLWVIVGMSRYNRFNPPFGEVAYL